MADLILSIGGDTRLLDAALSRSLNKPRSLGNLNVASIEQPLGRITGSASEFNKSLAASNARVIAFGASAGAIFAVRAAFDKLVSSTIEVENTLTEINTLLGLSTRQLGAFGVALLGAANTAGVSFENAAKAAQEFARQGLSAEETITRTSDALALARLSGVDFGEAVSSLTAIVNSFKTEALTTTEVVERLAEVDAKFAITASGIAEALKRVGSSAEDANITLNETIALITAAQQVTGRGEAIIGNAFKTIFTRVQRPQVLADLESIGVLTRNSAGDILPMVTILKNLAGAYDTLSTSEKSFISENVASVYQINTLKAVLGDLGSGFSFYDQSLKAAENSTGSVQKRLSELNETLATKLVKSLNAVTLAASGLGNTALGKSLGGILDYISRSGSSIAKFLNPTEDVKKSFGELDLGDKGVEVGGRFLKGLVSGFANILSGPGLQVIFSLIFKLFERLAKFAAEAIGELGEIGKKKQVIKALEKESLDYLKQNPQVLAQIRDGTKTVASVHSEIIDRIRIQNTLLKYQFDQAQAIARLSYASGITAKPASSARKGTFFSGYVPNYDAEMMEKAGALAGGYQPGMIKHMEVAGLGDVIYNSAETVTHLPGADKPYISPPENSAAGRAHREESLSKNGIDPYRDFAAKGIVPNFAENIRRGAIYNLGTKQVRVLEQVGENWKVKHHDLFEKVVPADQLELANIAQVKSYMRWRDAKGRYMAGGFIPNLAVNKFQTAPKAQPVIPEQAQIAMVEKMIARAKARGPIEDTTLDRRKYPEGRPKFIGLTAAESGSLFQNGVSRDKINAARAMFDKQNEALGLRVQGEYQQVVEGREERVASTLNKLKVKQIKNTTDNVEYNGVDRFTMFSDRISGSQTGQVNAGSGRDLDKGTFTASFRAAKLKDKFPFKSVLEPKISKAYFDAYKEIGFEQFGIFKADTFADTLNNVNDSYGVVFGSLFDSMIRHAIQGESGVRNKDALGQGSSRFDVKRPIPLLSKLFDLEGSYEMGDFKFGGLGDNAKSMAKKIQSQWAEESVAGIVDPRVTRKAGAQRSESEKAAEKAAMEEALKKFGSTTPAAIASYGLVPNLASSSTIQRVFDAAKRMPNGASIIAKLNEGTGIPDEKFLMAASKLGVNVGTTNTPKKQSLDEFFANAAARFKAQEEREAKIRSIPLSENEVKNVNFVQGLFKQKFGNLADTKKGVVGKSLVELRDAAYKGKDYINFGESHEDFLKSFEQAYIGGSKKKYVQASLFGIDTDTEDQVTKQNERRNNMYEKNLYKRFSKYKTRGRFAEGLVPNFANMEGAVDDAIDREMDAGYSRSQVKVGYDERLTESGGLGVYNVTEGSLGNAIDLHMAMGKTIGQVQDSGKGAAAGMVPNLAFENEDTITGFSNIGNQLTLAFSSFLTQGERATGVMDRLSGKYPTFFGQLGSALGVLGVRMKETSRIAKESATIEQDAKTLAEQKNSSKESKSLVKSQQKIEQAQEDVQNAQKLKEKAIRTRELVSPFLDIKDPKDRAKAIADINKNPLRLEEKAEINRLRGLTSKAEIKESSLVSLLKRADKEDISAQATITKSSIEGSDATIGRDRARKRLENKFSAQEAALTERQGKLEEAKNKEQTRREQSGRNRAAVSSFGLKSSLAIAGGGGVLTELAFGSTRSQTRAAIENFTSGLTLSAQVLTAFPGPIGVGVAGVIALGSAIKSLDTAMNEYSENLIAAADQEKARTQRINASVDGYIRSLSSLQEVYSSGTASAEQIIKLQNNLARELSNLRTAGVSEDKISGLATASSDKERFRLSGAIKEDQNRVQDDANFAASLASTVEKKIGQTGALGLGTLLRTAQGIGGADNTRYAAYGASLGLVSYDERANDEERKLIRDVEGNSGFDFGRENIFDDKFSSKGGGKKLLKQTTGDILAGFDDKTLESFTKRVTKFGASNLSSLSSVYGDKNTRLAAANQTIDSLEGRNELTLNLAKEAIVRKAEKEALAKVTTERRQEVESLRIAQDALESFRRRTLALNAALLDLAAKPFDDFIFNTKIDNKVQEGSFSEESIRNKGLIERRGLFVSETSRATDSSAQASREIANRAEIGQKEIRAQALESFQRILLESTPQIKKDSVTGTITGGSEAEREGLKFVTTKISELLSDGKGFGEAVKSLQSVIDKDNTLTGGAKKAAQQFANLNPAEIQKLDFNQFKTIATKGLEEAQALTQEATRMNEQLKLIAENSKINFGGGSKNFLDKKEGRALDRDIRRGLRQSSSNDPIRAGRGSLELGIALQKFTGGQLDKSSFSAFTAKAEKGIEADLKRRINSTIGYLESQKRSASPEERKNLDAQIKQFKGFDTKAIAKSQVEEALKLNDTQAQLQTMKAMDESMKRVVELLGSTGIKVKYEGVKDGINPTATAEAMSKAMSASMKPIAEEFKTAFSSLTSALETSNKESIKKNEAIEKATETDVENQQTKLKEFFETYKNQSLEQHKAVLEGIEEMLKKLNKPIEQFGENLSKFPNKGKITAPPTLTD